MVNRPIQVIQNFAKTDCIHYDVREVPSCCNRTHKAGGCFINWKGNIGMKTCSTQMKWCNYQPKGGTEDVHPT